MSPEREREQLHKGVVRLRIMSIILAIVLAFLAAVLYRELFPPAKPFDPLRFPGQTVLSRVKGVNGPAVKVGRNLVVTGKACSLDGSAVELRGHTFWATAKPPGTTILVNAGVNIRNPGCKVYRFSNPMPPAVVAAARRVGPDAYWRLQGDATPTKPHGVTRVWRTAPFRIVLP